MTKLKLGPIEDDKPVKLTIELPPSLFRDLVAYGEALGRQSGAPPIDPARLVSPMLRQIMSTDRQFARSRRTGSLS